MDRVVFLVDIFIVKTLTGMLSAAYTDFCNLFCGDSSHLVFIGETHEEPLIIGFVRHLLRCTCKSTGLFLGLEHFNVEQQKPLDEWIEWNMSWSELAEEYSKGREGFNLEIYRPLLETARECGIRIIGVMPPREKANEYARTGVLPEKYSLSIDVDPHYWAPYPTVISGLFPRSGPMARIPVEKLLRAQSYKDSYAAERIVEALIGGYQSGLILMGWAHIEPKGAVPTRVKATLKLEPDAISVVGFHRREETEWARDWVHFLNTDYFVIFDVT